MSIRTSVMAVRTAALVVASAGLATSVLASPTYTTIALTGVSNQYGPGMGAGVTFGGSFSSSPVISNSGNVALRGNLATANGGAEGMWVFGGGVNYGVAIAGGVRPDGGAFPAGTSGIINGMAVNDAGQWFVRQGSQTGLFTNSGRVALAGDVAPGTGGATYGTSAVSTGTPLYNQVGQVSYIGNYTTGTGSPVVTTTAPNNNASGLYTGTAGATTLQIRQNQTSSLLDSGTGPTGIVQVAGESRIGSFATGSLAFNNNGAFVVSANLQGANIITTTSNAARNNGVILTNRNGSLEVIARAGTAAPDATGAPSATDLYSGTASTGINGNAIGFNNAGHVVFTSALRNVANTTTSSAALFSDNGGTLRQIARAGAAMPTIYNPDGTINTSLAGFNWSGFGTPIINSQNTVAFTSQNNSSTAFNALITMDASGRMTSIAQYGMVAEVGGAPLGGDARISSPGVVQMNALGQVVFSTTLINENGIFGGPGGNNSSIMAWDPVAGLMQIARTGNSFTVAPGDVRVISGLGGPVTTGQEDGRQISLNNSGQFAFSLSFTDGSSGVFYATIPTPGAAGLLGMAGLFASRRRRV